MCYATYLSSNSPIQVTTHTERFIHSTHTEPPRHERFIQLVFLVMMVNNPPNTFSGLVCILLKLSNTDHRPRGHYQAMKAEAQTSEALRNLLSKGDEADRCYAARTLGILRDENATHQLIERLQDEDLDVCIDATEALGKIGAKSAVPALIEFLNNDPSGEVCAIAVESLGQIGSLEALETLTKIAIERPEQMEWNDDWDTWWDVQLEAVKALGLFGNEAAVDTLLHILDDEGSQDIENSIFASLASIPGKGVNTLIERLQLEETPPIGKRRICKALSLAQSDDATRALGRALQNEDAEVRAAAATGLAATDAQRYASALLMLLRDQKKEVRASALKAISTLAQNGQSLSKETVQDLLPTLEDSSSQVRGTLISILNTSLEAGDLSESQIASVMKSLSDESAETAAAACTLLGKNNDPQALPALLELLQFRGGHPMVRRQAALAVGEMGLFNEETLDTLTRCVGDQQQPVRLGALSALMLLEHQFDASQKELQRPLEIIISAVQGEIEIAPSREQIIEKLHNEARSEEDIAAAEALASEDPIGLTTSDNEEPKRVFEEGEALPDEFADYIKAPEAKAESSTEVENIDQPKPLELPEVAGKIVEKGEVKTAVSTLDAIAMDNVEVTLGLNTAEEDATELDEVTEEYLAVVEENKETMKRIRSEKNIKPEHDVRRLGARILSECEEPSAISTLIEALNNEDSLLRREAADAVGIIGARNPKIPQLMDAVGILITHLAMGDMLQKVTCARALGYLGNKTALQPLIYALEDKEVNVRVQAIDALERLVIQGADPKEADHMVVIELSPLSVSKRLLACFEDEELGVRVAATRSLAAIVPTLREVSFTDRVIDTIVGSVAKWTGEEARPVGRCLRKFDKQQCTEKLLIALDSAEDSLKRSVYIEILEELLNPELGQSEQAA